MSLGDALSIIGLVIAIWQIHRTGKIAAATKKAVEEASQRISLYNILLVVPELSRIEHDLERAVQADDDEQVRRLLREWREVASDFRGLLAREGGSDNKLDGLVQLSLTQVVTAKSQIVSGKGAGMLSSTRRAREAIEAVCLEARLMAARIRSSATPLGVLHDPNGRPTAEGRTLANKARRADNG
jgi:hypothetical protein